MVALVEDRLHEGVATAHYIAYHPKIWLERELIGTIALEQLDALGEELRAHRRINIGVASRDAVAGRLRDRGDAPHEGAADAEDVNVHGRGKARRDKSASLKRARF